MSKEIIKRRKLSKYFRKTAHKYRQYVNSANRRKIDLTLSESEMISIYFMPCHYCGHKPGKLNGIDRIDNTKGYCKGNVVPCCKLCNFMKGTLDVDVFIDKVKSIFRNHKRNYPIEHYYEKREEEEILPDLEKLHLP